MNDGTASSSSSVIHRRRRDLDLAHPPFDESSLVDTPLIQSKHTVPEVATPSSRFDWRAHITREGARAGMGAGWGRDAKVILDE